MYASYRRAHADRGRETESCEGGLRAAGAGRRADPRGESGSGGARSHEFRSDECPGNRVRRAVGRPLRRTGPRGNPRCGATRQRAERHRGRTPTAPTEVTDRGVIGDGTGNRVSVNGADGPRDGQPDQGPLQVRRSGNRQPNSGAAPFAGQPVVAPNGNEAGQPAHRATTGIARRALRHDGRCVGRVEG
jgi:hypothetical protein